MAAKRAETYRHEDEALLRPDVGTQAQFRQKKPPKSYRYDSSLSPALDWDGQNPARERGEELIRRIQEADSLKEARAAADELARLGRPFLDWAGKAERLSFDVPTLPLFVHERLSTKAILETLKGHERDRQLELQLFADPQLPLHQQLEAYEHKGGWTNRLILGDSLVVMNSLLVRGPRRPSAARLHRPALRRQVRLPTSSPLSGSATRRTTTTPTWPASRRWSRPTGTPGSSASTRTSPTCATGCSSHASCSRRAGASSPRSRTRTCTTSAS